MEDVEEPVINTKITDVIDDCLEKVFDYLSINDLFNVAESNSFLREAAKSSFKRGYSTTNIILDDITVFSRRIPLEYDESSNTDVAVRSIDLKSSYKLLRYFGNFVSKLTLKCVPWSVSGTKHRLYSSEFYDISCARLMIYISEYCSESLKEIRFKGDFSSGVEFKEALKNLTKPFPNIKSVEITDDFHFQTEFYGLFPQMLRLKYAETFDICFARFHRPPSADSGNELFPQNQEMNLPLLQNLSVDVNWKTNLVMYQPEHELYKKRVSHLDSFLCSSPQIRSLTMPFLRDETFLDGLSENIPLLESLEFRDIPPNFYNFSSNFEYLKRFRVHLFENEAYETDPEKLVLIFRLEIFEWGIGLNNVEFPYEFIENNPSITKLRIFTLRPVNREEICISRLANALPNLTEIDFGDWNIIIKSPLDYFNAIKTLSNFTFVSKFDNRHQPNPYLERDLSDLGLSVTMVHRKRSTSIITLKRSN